MAQGIWKKWWWVIIFCFCVAGFYWHAINQKQKSFHELSFRLKKLEKEKQFALQEKEDLALQIASKADPAWIEMVLMRDLGLVPEGWLKVHFRKE